jgi:hypothetical protein
MNDYTFTLRFLAPGQSPDALSRELYEQVEEASLMGPDEDGSFLVELDRCAPSLSGALTTALAELLRALPHATVLRVEGNDLATMADIAKRTGRSPESIRLLVNGQRGPGGFPPAAGRLDARIRVWRWTDVARWFEDALREALPGAADSAFLQAFNDALEIRRLSARLGKAQRRAITKLLADEPAAAA